MTQLPLLDEPEPEVTDELSIAFEVFGRQSPQGSKQAQVIYRKGPDETPVPVTKNGRVLTVTRNDSPNLESWRGAVADAARKAYSGPLLIGAMELEITFYRPRPKSHFNAAGKLKASAPKYPLPKPDNSKLRRAIEDSMTGVVYRDDSLIVNAHDYKRFGDCYRTVVRVTSLDGLTEERF
jgi:Holliday junction resolvase RusA-like endonuclease